MDVFLHCLTWFNPPFNRNVKTKVGKCFLELVRKHFNANHKYHKLLNTNTLKLSYSCTASIGNIIKQHNTTTLKKENEIRPCNCRVKQNCPLNEKCLSTCIIYKAEVTTSAKTHVYYGACEGEFKQRYNNHTKSFRLRKYEHETELSKLIWSLKDRNTDYQLKWDIAAKSSPYKCGSRRCDLCLSEKTCILRANTFGLLNKRTELLSKCRHRNKYTLSNLKWLDVRIKQLFFVTFLLLAW